jgi:hypothetical protein
MTLNQRKGLRFTHAISRRQADNIRRALRYSDTQLKALGCPLNTFVTLNFDYTDCPPAMVSKAFERLRDNHFTRWLRYQAQTAYYVWVLENQGGDTHVYRLVHIPKIAAGEVRR